MDDFLNLYKIHYTDMATRLSDARLVRQEQYVSQLIDLDFASELFQIDEILVLHDVLRDECVRRVRCSSDGECLGLSQIPPQAPAVSVTYRLSLYLT